MVEGTMRLIGHLKSESSAKTLGDYLVSLDIRNLVEPDGEGWAVWIYSEDQIEAGRLALFPLNTAGRHLTSPAGIRILRHNHDAVGDIEPQQSRSTWYARACMSRNGS